jgi:predicted RNase H-like HicB family nuclease
MTQAKKTFVITVQYQADDGVYLSTCDSMPGLIVQTDTVDEAVNLAPQLANDLLDSDPTLPGAGDVIFEFNIKENQNG